MGASRREFRGNLEQKLINGIAREVYFGRGFCEPKTLLDRSHKEISNTFVSNRVTMNADDTQKTEEAAAQKRKVYPGPEGHTAHRQSSAGGAVVRDFLPCFLRWPFLPCFDDDVIR
jgi:hypothetical protein